jgi:hypothetical protein
VQDRSDVEPHFHYADLVIHLQLRDERTRTKLEVPLILPGLLAVFNSDNFLAVLGPLDSGRSGGTTLAMEQVIWDFDGLPMTEIVIHMSYTL